MNTVKVFVFFATFYKLYISFFWIITNVLLLYELFIPFENGLLIGMLLLLFIVHFFFDYFSFYELHDLDLKGSKYMLLTLLVVFLIGMIEKNVANLEFLKIVVSNIGCFLIFKVELKRISFAIEKLRIFFHNSFVKRAKIFSIIILIAIFVYIIFIMIALWNYFTSPVLSE